MLKLLLICLFGLVGYLYAWNPLETTKEDIQKEIVSQRISIDSYQDAKKNKYFSRTLSELDNPTSTVIDVTLDPDGIDTDISKILVEVNQISILVDKVKSQYPRVTQEFECPQDIFNKSYCPVGLLPADRNITFDDGSAISFAGSEVIFDNGESIEHNGTVVDFMEGSTTVHTGQETIFDNGNTAKHTGTVRDYARGHLVTHINDETLYTSGTSATRTSSTRDYVAGTVIAHRNTEHSYASSSNKKRTGTVKDYVAGTVTTHTATGTVYTGSTAVKKWNYVYDISTPTFTTDSVPRIATQVYNNYTSRHGQISDGAVACSNGTLYWETAHSSWKTQGNFKGGWSSWQYWGLYDNPSDTTYWNKSVASTTGIFTTYSLYYRIYATSCYKTAYTCPSGYTDNGNACTRQVATCPSTMTLSSTGKTCYKKTWFNYYTYTCPSGYATANAGMSSCSKTDPNRTLITTSLSNSCNSSTAPSNNCSKSVTAKAYEYGCPSYYTVVNSGKTSCPSGTSGACNSSTAPANNCYKNVNYNYYEYGCPSGYTAQNVGLTLCTKTDPNRSVKNEHTLNDSCNSSTAPANNCIKSLASVAYEYRCGTGYTRVTSGLTSCPTGTSGACNSSIEPLKNCWKDIYYKYYQYGCSSGYYPQNVGLTSCSKTDPDYRANNSSYLDNSCNSSSAPVNNCEKIIQSTAYEYGCPTAYTIVNDGQTSCPPGTVGTCNSSTVPLKNCWKDISFNFYEYGCPTGYHAKNSGLRTYTKLDPNSSQVNASTLDDNVNSPTAPVNNCEDTIDWISYEYTCPDDYTVIDAGLTSCPSGTVGSCNTSTPPTTENCKKTIKYKYYEYGCPLGYSPENYGLFTFEKIDPDKKNNNEHTLSESANSKTAPVNNCSIEMPYNYYNYICPESFDVLNPGGDFGYDATYSPTPPSKNCKKTVYLCDKFAYGSHNKTFIPDLVNVGGIWRCSTFKCGSNDKCVGATCSNGDPQPLGTKYNNSTYSNSTELYVCNDIVCDAVRFKRMGVCGKETNCPSAYGVYRYNGKCYQDLCPAGSTSKIDEDNKIGCYTLGCPSGYTEKDSDTCEEE